MQPRLFALLAGLLSLATSSLHAADAIREMPTWVSNRYWQPASARSVVVRIEPVRIDDRAILRFRYELGEGSGNYAGGYLHTTVSAPFAELRLSARTTVAGTLTFRLYDAEGETIQYSVPLSASEKWIEIRIPIARPKTTFAEKKGIVVNGQADFPTTGIFFGIEFPKGDIVHGDLQITDVELVR